MYNVTVTNKKDFNINISDTMDVTINSGESVELSQLFDKDRILGSEQLFKAVDDGFLDYYDGSEEPENLAILSAYKYSKEEEVRDVNFAIIGLTKESPTFDKGRKLSAAYTCPKDNRLVIKKFFTDRFDEVDGRLLGLDIHFEWYRNNGEIAVTKEEFKPLSQYEAGELLKKRRDRGIDYLIEGGKGTPAEPLVDAIFNHYSQQTIDYIATGGTQLLDAINNETDPTINAYLDTVINAPTGETVRDAILYQIT